MYLHAPPLPNFYLMGSTPKEGVMGREHAGDPGTWWHGQGHSFCLGDQCEKRRLGLGLGLGWERKLGDNLAASSLPSGSTSSPGSPPRVPWPPEVPSPSALLLFVYCWYRTSRTGWSQVASAQGPHLLMVSLRYLGYAAHFLSSKWNKFPFV